MKKLFKYFQDDLIRLFIPIVVFFYFTIPVISWGTPNNEHPFSYHMDEWHLFTALKEAYFKGPFNAGERVGGPYFFTFSTVPYLIPFWLSGIVRLYDRGYLWQHTEILTKVFVVLRSFSLLHGIGTIIVVYYLGKKFFHKNVGFLAGLFLVLNPSFPSWSMFYNYDIGNTFWTTAALFFIFKILKSPKLKNYVLTAIFSGFAIGTKVSALPLVPIIFLSHFLVHFQKKSIKKILFNRKLFIACTLLIIVFIIFGVPFVINKDRLYFLINFHKTTWRVYRLNPTISNPFSYPVFFYPLFQVIFRSYGHGLFILLLLGFFAFFKSRYKKEDWLLFLSLIIFYIPIGRMGLGSHNGRILMYLPILALFVARFIYFDLRPVFMRRRLKKLFYLLLIIVFIYQFIYADSIFAIQRRANVRQLSSEWLKLHLKDGDRIAVEGDPIYINPPDIVQNDYFKFHKYKYQYFGGENYDYRDLIGPKPDFIIMSITQPGYKDLIFRTSESNQKIARFWDDLLSSSEYELAARFGEKVDFFGFGFGLGESYGVAGFEDPKIHIFKRVVSTF